MPRKTPSLHRFNFFRIYFAPTAALLLWLGVCAVAYVSLSPLALERPAVSHAPASPTHTRPAHGRRAGSDKPLEAQRASAKRKAASRNPRQAAAADAKPKPKTNRAAARPQTASANSPPAPAAAKTPAPNTPRKPKTGQRPAATDNTHRPGRAKAQAKPANKTKPAGQQSDQSRTRVAKASPKVSPHVMRAQLTSGIEDREPVDRITHVFHTRHKAVRVLYYFTQIKGLRGQTVTHNWWHAGRLIAKVTFHIGGNAWRVYSSKKLARGMTGAWRVVVNDSQGKTLASARFVYKAP